MRLVIFLLRRTLGVLLGGVLFTLLGGGRTARRLLRTGSLLRRLTGL